MRATIIGAGIAGPVLAIFLRRLGVEVTVFEARTSDCLGFGGASVGIAPNGMNVLKAAGVAERIRAVSEVCHGVDYFDGEGRHIARHDDFDHGERYGSPRIVTRRARLVTELVAAAREAGARIEYGARLVDLEQDGREVRALFSNGREASSDFLVGCDGLRSATRTVALPDAPAPVFFERFDYGGAARWSHAPIEIGRQAVVFGRRAAFAAFRMDDDEILWFHSGSEPEDERADRERVIDAHASDPAWVREIVERTPIVLGPWPVSTLPSLPRWSIDRVGVIGDAAHAVSPTSDQGASLAMEDAMMLARCLEVTWKPERAFELLVDRRRARVEEIAKYARRMSSTRIARSAPIGWLRDRMLPIVLPLKASAHRRLYDYRVEVAP